MGAAWYVVVYRHGFRLRFVVTEKFMERVGQLGTAEFTQMMELRKLNMRIEVQKAKLRKKPEFQPT